MAAKKEESTLYVRNGRPNMVAFTYAGQRYTLDRRGTRTDTTALPAEAVSDSVIARWMKSGILEKISRDSFMKLAARQVDVEPSQFLKRPVRDGKKADLIMHSAVADATHSKTTVRTEDVRKTATPKLEWAGELMSTEEELEEMDYESSEANYPSHHRDSDEAARRQMGY